MQVIITVSKLLDSSTALNCKRFQESLSVINCFATGDKAMKGTGNNLFIPYFFYFYLLSLFVSNDEMHRESINNNSLYLITICKLYKYTDIFKINLFYFVRLVK